jgi:hypothetical protein
MHARTAKLLITATAMIVCPPLALGLLFSGSFFGRSTKTLIRTNYSDEVTFELGPGMGPNLMTPKSYQSTHGLIDMINAEFNDEWLAVGQTSMTRRYMSALINGEGCKSYVDYGDGKWVLIDDDTSDHSNLEIGGDPFGDANSNSNPFE